MKAYWLTLGILGVWRVTHLLHAEDGPGHVIVRLRRRVGSGVVGAAMDCFKCLSVWTAVPFALTLGDDNVERGLLWPALSGGAIVVEGTVRRLMPDRAVWVEDPPVLAAEFQSERNDVQLRTTETIGRDLESNPHDGHDSGHLDERRA